MVFSFVKKTRLKDKTQTQDWRTTLKDKAKDMTKDEVRGIAVTCNSVFGRGGEELSHVSVYAGGEGKSSHM